ncbi:hypothetical protein FRUB_00140 [Fimbriiglobus ruber]|uniref:Uncharacterized protein n=1 Tax=Fimbriiglobus ruber TaxID=1908690 RepID=A0A225DYL6_9BACT|nr:hypothetical protein FRUB_00140 [Fimbriiglobus ruber]
MWEGTPWARLLRRVAGPGRISRSRKRENRPRRTEFGTHHREPQTGNYRKDVKKRQAISEKSPREFECVSGLLVRSRSGSGNMG